MRFPSAGERRSSPRLRLPMMYTLLRAGPVSSNGFCWTGRAYDISASGMRFEVDGELRPGDVLNLRVLLPGRKRQLRLRVQGEVIRIHHPQLANGRGMFGHQLRPLPSAPEARPPSSLRRSRPRPYATSGGVAPASIFSAASPNPPRHASLRSASPVQRPRSRLVG